ncbi:GH25 family lysozyme [Bifidobacterium sp. ESL0775]|uniref:GH25 family lysozyme n=1 Tax=Bifidobacterium sp. ESL0775 TaxID=2983230 RepID=UPI0023F9A959|nr:GH25 family lysozyme [Bifidobacterium sp. ESL0775]WEV69540.1 GH25 family lysozyme [Bifidobacterium sp. ESL0775]
MKHKLWNKVVGITTKVGTVLVASALGVTFSAVPATAATDTNLSDFNNSVEDSAASQVRGGAVKTIGNQAVASASDASEDAMPDNSSQKLPDKVSSAIPDNAMVVSKDLATTADGQIKNIETGAPVTDPKLVGTADQQPDPLTKTNGMRFIPVEAGKVKEAVAANGGDVQASTASSNASASKATTTGTVRNAALQNNQYGAYWGSYNGTQAFFERGGNLFAQQAKGVVDVSEHQGYINWDAAKNSGVEGAIIRVAFGWGNRLDYQAARNVNECKRLGIPFGVYFYSYAYDYDTATQEGFDAVNKLRQLGINPGDLSYPVYYDLENWSWTGHTPPTNPWVYDSMVSTWYWCLQHFGYNNLSVYSYTYYLNTALNTGNIRSKTRWVASYGARTNFGYSTNDRGWQYADNGWVNGIGNVDLNAFGNRTYQSSVGIVTFPNQEMVGVCGVVAGPHRNVEYQWMAYNLSTNTWKAIAWWQDSNCAEWRDNAGDYWLHLDVRDKQTHNSIGNQTLPTHYKLNASINGIYLGWQGDQMLLGAASNDSQGKYVIKLYDENAQRWFTAFYSQWALWRPYHGRFWARYELYTSDGRFVDTRTYNFSV